jgi:hypothetical protein
MQSAIQKTSESARYACLAALCALSVASAFAQAPATSVTGVTMRAAIVSVEPRRLSINGQREIPPSLFGVEGDEPSQQMFDQFGIGSFRHVTFVPAAAPSALDQKGRPLPNVGRLALYIDCLGERALPATVLTNPGYEDYFAKLGAEYATRCRSTNWTACVEFWNEPFLDWADCGRRNYANAFYDVSKATDEGPVTIKGWEKPLEHLRWRRYWATYEADRTRVGATNRADTVARERRIAWGVRVPEGLRAGDTFDARDTAPWAGSGRRTFVVAEEWHVYDPTQVRWWSGRQNLAFYLWMLTPFARAAKEQNPNLAIVAGWGFNPSAAEWAVWRELYVPVLDAVYPWIDGLNEHHFEADTRKVVSWYEVAVAYSVNRHGKWIRMYNTGCGGRWQPAIQGMAALSGDAREAARETASQAAYTLRDLAEMLCQCPDKAGSRIVTDPETQAGALDALQYLRDLRGAFLRTSSDDRSVWPVAAVSNGRLVVFAFNNAQVDRAVDFRVALPDRLSFAPKGEVVWMEVGESGRLKTATQVFEAKGREAVIQRVIPSQQAVKVLLRFTGGDWPSKPGTDRRQFFAKEGVLHKVLPESPLMLRIPIPPETVRQSDRAWLKLVIEGTGVAGGSVAFNERLLTVQPKEFTEMYQIETMQLRLTNEVMFTCTGEPGSGYQVNAASLVLDLPAR